jgi:hypothetical protein
VLVPPSDDAGAPDASDAGSEVVAAGVVTVEPRRILADRAVGPGFVRCWSVSGQSGVPADATGVVVNVTAAAPSGPGYAVVYPDVRGDRTTPPPATSTVNFEPGEDVSNQTFVPLPPNGDLCHSTQGAASVSLLVDLAGYVAPDSGVVLGTPGRLLDTRPPGIGEVGGPLTPRVARPVQVAGQLGVPADAEAVIVTVTVDGARSPGNLRVFRDGLPPETSVVNYAVGFAKANTTLVPLADDGTVVLFSDSESPVHVVVDVLGYTQAGSDYVAVEPTRVFDTRLRAGPVRAWFNNVVPIPRDVVPADAVAVVLTVTAIDPTTLGHLRVHPGLPDGAYPFVSAVNYIIGRDVANLVVSALPADGRLAMYSDQHGSGTVHVAVDVVGYVTP